ncbi:MAG: LysR family transcriptional regulator [Pseudomonadota bacterium]
MNDKSLDWNAVRAFAIIAREGTMTAAAKTLGTSQPTLGRHLDALERHLGATLFVRGRGGMAPTEAGSALLARAEAMEREADALQRAASGRRMAAAGDVRITASRVVAFNILPDVVAALAATEPAIQLDIVATDKIADLLARDADLAIRMVRPTQPDVIATRLGDLAIGAYAARSYLDASDGPARIRTVEDLRGHRLIGYDRSPLILNAMRRLGLAADRGLFAIRTDDQVLYHRLVAQGAGLGFLPHLVARAQGLVHLPLAIEPPALPVWLAAHRDLRTNLAVRRTADIVRRVFADVLDRAKTR